MKKGYWFILIGILFFACQIDKDQQAIESLIKADTVWFNTNTEVDSAEPTAQILVQTEDTAIIWWRGKQTHPGATIDIEIVGDSAYVEWTRGNKGNLNIWTGIPGEPAKFWQKEVVETAKLNAVFHRTGSVSDPNRGWVLEKISCAWGESDNVHTVKIDSIRIESASNSNLVIKDPLSTFYDTTNLITFAPAESIDITLYTSGPEANAFLHTFILILPFYVRTPFQNLGNGIHKGTWRAQLIPFPRYAIFDILNHKTLYTEEESYDFNGWLLPYNIKAQ